MEDRTSAALFGAGEGMRRELAPRCQCLPVRLVVLVLWAEVYLLIHVDTRVMNYHPVPLLLPSRHACL